MKKTAALFATAGALVVGAIGIDLWFKHLTGGESPVPPPIPPRPTPDAIPVGSSSARIGELVTADAFLSNSQVLASSEGEMFLRIDLAATDLPGAERAPLSLAVVIDKSGSMAGDKMERTKSAAKQLVSRLSDRDRVAIILYATEFSVALPLTPVVSTERARINRVIDEIMDGGGTNISGGLETALAELDRERVRGAASRVILMSDGNANQGLTEPDALGDIARRAREHGITVSTIGVGLDFNEKIMTVVAESGGGGYHYVREGDGIAAALDSELRGLTALAAKSVEVGLDLQPGWSVREVYGYRTETRGGRMIIPVGDMAARTHRQIMVRLGVPSRAAGSLPVADLTLGYVNAISETAREFRAGLSVVSTSDYASVSAGERRDVLESIEAVRSAETRKNAAAAFQSGNKGHALGLLQKQAIETRAQATSLGSAVLAEQARELENAAIELDAADAQSDNGKDLVKREKARARQIFAY